MQNLLPNDWREVFRKEFEKEYWCLLTNKVQRAYEEHTCYPKLDDVFNAFQLCAFEDVKVVVIGQDPYHGKGQANGLCFSYVDSKKFPPSLKNIYKEVATDLGVAMPTTNGDLSAWAKQGVLLLNACLTVTEGKPNSHKSFGWHSFTDTVIKTLSDKNEQIVFLLWGGFAQKKEQLIAADKHLVLKATHPSPLGANKGGWFGCQHFSKANNYLKANGKKEIDWALEDKNQPPTLFTL